MIDEKYTEISQDKIEEVERKLKSGFCDYRIRDSEFTAETFEDSGDITLIQVIGEEDIELVF